MKVRHSTVIVLVLLLLLTFCFTGFAQEQEQVVTDQGYVVFKVDDPRVFVKGPNAAKFGTYISRHQADGAPDVTVFKIDCTPYINRDGRTMVPVRYLSNALGVADTNVKWNGALQQVTLAEPGMPAVKMTIGRSVIVTDEQEKPIDTAPEVAPPGRTMLPARFVAEALGYTVEWDSQNRIVYCWKGQKPKEQVRQEILNELNKELTWKTVGVNPANIFVLPPGGKILSGNGAYYINGVKVRDDDDGTVFVLTTVDVEPRATLPGNVTWEQQMATLRLVLETNLGPGEFTDKLAAMANEKDSRNKNYPPLMLLTAPDGRHVMVRDGGGGIFIAINPPGVKFE